MNIDNKTIKSGFSLPIYGLGTWQMGGRMTADYSKDAEEIAAISSAINHGVTHIDTAEVYGAGHSEELVGQAIQGYDRSKLFIASKVIGSNQRYDDVIRSCHASLQRLGTSYLDLYLLHRYPDQGIDIKETMRAMDQLVSDGLIKNIGVCNFSVNRLKVAQEQTKNKIVCNQVHYSLDCREIIEKGVLEYCQLNDIMVVAWGPLSKGTLENALILQELARKYKKTSYQIALNWLIAQDNVVTIPKTTQVKHLEENLGALGWVLEPDDVQDLSDKFPNQRLVSDRVPLSYEADVEA